MIALSLLLAAVPQLQVPEAMFHDTAVTGGDARLVWPARTMLSVEDVEGEVVVRFDRPIDDAAIDAFRDAAGAAIGDLRWNDASLVLRAAPGWELCWRRTGTVVAVAFARQPDEIVVEARDGAPDIDVDLLAIEANVAAGYPGQGRRAAEALARRHPGDARVARIVADARNADGDVAGAARAYRAIGATDRTARRAQAFAPGIASAGVTVRDGDDLSQVEGAARVDIAVGDGLIVGGGARYVHSSVATATGRVRTGAPIVDAAVSTRIGDAARAQLVLASALDNGVTGGGVRVTAGSAEAQWRAALLLHQPDYSTAEQSIAGGYLSRATIGATRRLAPGLSGQFDIGGNRYGLAGMAMASETLTASGGIDYIRRRGALTIGATYRFEAEYIQRTRNGADGRALIDLADRENHTVQGLLGASLGEMQLTGLAGWTVDRFGGNGPNASVGFNLPVATAWRIEGSGGVTSIARAGFSGQQRYARALISRGLGNGR